MIWLSEKSYHGMSNMVAVCRACLQLKYRFQAVTGCAGRSERQEVGRRHFHEEAVVQAPFHVVVWVRHHVDEQGLPWNACIEAIRAARGSG